ncbi:hypothetical protein LZ198_37925 [Myxococcus sp. K15C18031901]|uniref:hypothetical protein n=1 Tax=Myxococcus dinghuensis TaxID=2906761 RepID=UPI0020A81BA3|nr:hypothetical protein [Myxococcus dinghuensis]MCP3104659.1 hypothetical protein [Myxococcus dinghuensis]
MSGLLVVVLTTLASARPAPKAQEPVPGHVLLAPKVGFFKSTAALSGDLYLAMELGYVTPLLKRRLAVTLEVGYHRPQKKGTLGDPQLRGDAADAEYTVAVREAAFLLSAVYRFERAVGTLTPYVGGGPGLYLHRATSDVLGATASESGGGFGFQALVGVELPVGTGGAFLEAHYHFAPLDLVTTGDVNVGGFLAGALGYRLRL